MRKWQLITKALGFAAAVLTAGSALGAEDHGHSDHENAAATTVAVPARQPAAAAHDASVRENRDNLPLLGGMLLVSGLVSWGISHLIRARGSGGGGAVTSAIVVTSETTNPAPTPTPASSS